MDVSDEERLASLSHPYCEVVETHCQPIVVIKCWIATLGKIRFFDAADGCRHVLVILPLVWAADVLGYERLQWCLDAASGDPGPLAHWPTGPLFNPQRG